jgi:hypothetical protein
VSCQSRSHGQPSYETIRAEYLKIAGGKDAPVAGRTNLKVA